MERVRAGRSGVVAGCAVLMGTEESGPYTTNIADLPWNKRPKHRYRCTSVSDVAALGKIRCSNGSIQYKAYCLDCGGKGSDLPHSDVVGLDEGRIAVLTNHDVTPCVRCGSTEGSEVHHWAPSHLFENSDEWPTSHLCRSCHMEWHRIVTPNMTARRAA